MCGIAGLFEYRSDAPLPDEQIGRRMVDAVAHRGPDDGGLLVGPGILLGHRRLAVIDLTENARQPMPDPDEVCWLVFNGEIYNFRECRSELEAKGHRFRSQSDTEVILRGYLEWGDEVLGRLNGMFAFALWDRRVDELWLARDPIGIKPLFYSDAGPFRFGSEIKAILADTRRGAEPDWQGLDWFLTFGYTPAPATGFAGIRQVLPGESLRVRRDGTVSHRRWYKLPYPSIATRGDLAESVARLDESLHLAVQRQMVSDVPLGALLSGGLDSSAIVRAMTRSGAESIETFTIGFKDRDFDESAYAAIVAERFGTRHHLRIVDADMAAILGIIVSHAEEPLADNSAIPFYMLSESVRRQVTVALSGDGADELLGGYDTYRASQLAPYYRAIPRVLRRAVIAPVIQRLPISRTKYGKSMLAKRFVGGAELPFPLDHCSWRRMVSAELRSELLTGRVLDNVESEPLSVYARALDDAPDGLSPLEQLLHLDLSFHLPNDMLVKVDRMSMAHGLEVRVPWLDLDVVRRCLAIPPEHKRRRGRGKIVLAESLKSELPPALVRRRKAGFLIPLERWLRHEWQPLTLAILTEEFARETGAFHWPRLQRMITEQAEGRADHAYALFALLVFGVWWRIWISGDMPRATRRPTVAPIRVQCVGPMGNAI